MRHGRPACPPHALLALSLLLLPAIAPPLRAEEPYVGSERFGTRVAPLLLLTRPDVQADLALSPQQVESAHQAIQDIHTRALALRGQPDTPDTIAARRAIDEAQLSWLSSQLTADQQTRLRQLDIQWEGPGALVSRPSLATTLALTADQQASLTRLVQDRATLRANSTYSAQQEADFIARSLAVLDDNQRQLWQSMKGPAFTLQATAPPAATRR